MDKISPNILPYKSAKKAAEEAKQQINDERKGEQFGLYSRWGGLNKAMRKYIRFANVYLLAGLSGHGKSFVLNILQTDFLDTKDIKDKKGNIIYKSLNSDCVFKPIILHFCFEMSAVNEMLRAVSNKIKKSYNYILSSEYISTIDSYNIISEEELIHIYSELDIFGKRPMYFFETAGNLSQIFDTVSFFHSRYPNHKFIVSIDHTLLTIKRNDESDIELMAATGNLGIALRVKFGDMVILVGQLNSEIEKPERRTKVELHYPQKSDIYAQSRVYHAADTVFTVHRPELLKIAKYGLQKRPTQNLIHYQILKARYGVIGNVWLRFNQETGEIIPYEEIKDENSIKFD